MPEPVRGKQRNSCSSLKLLSVKILPYWLVTWLAARSEGPADGKPEHAPLFEIRIGLSESGHGIGERVVVREERAIRHDGRLDELLDNRRIVGPVQPERCVDYGQHHLQF